jgi:ribonucleoside-diphosphate reductase alpha chain
MMIKRHFTEHYTTPGQSPYSEVEWREFEIDSFDKPVEAPAHWSPTAVEIAATKYFRRRGVSQENPSEQSVRQLIQRVVRTIRRAGEAQGYFKDSEQAQIFEDEIAHILLMQKASFNSPVYFNVGIFSEYGIMGTAENFVVDLKTGRATAQTNALVHPQASACFIQDIKDDLLGIFDLLKSEAKLFKYGSGTGTNFSTLRSKGESLEGGGETTGLISYLEIFDKAAGAIKSGGTTRRAAKMVVVDADHPEILEFIRWKMMEERKARVLLANGFSGGMDGEAFRTVSGQNSNNSVRVTDDFIKRATEEGTWELKSRKGRNTVREIPAKEIFQAIARAAWECADPGIQYHDTIQKWHLCPANGPIRASNPCSEYMFLDNSACNLASLNLVAFLNTKTNDLDWPAFKQTVGLMLLAQEILVDYASYPTAEICENSHRFRPLGLGYANLGGLLMRMGIPYDSEEGVRVTAKITAAMHGLSLLASGEWAQARGAFKGWNENRAAALKVLDLHVEAAKKIDSPWIQQAFAHARTLAGKTGLRNAQVTLLAPTGTIGLLMDCDTLGIEPDFALVKRKTLAGGGELRLVNQSVVHGLKVLGYDGQALEDILKYASLNGTVAGAPGLSPQHEAVFDCAVPPKDFPHRRISVEGHLRVMAAAQPFLSGAISKTVNLPHSATVENIEDVFLRGWELGLKSLAVYRDGSKALQPLCAEC